MRTVKTIVGITCAALLLAGSAMAQTTFSVGTIADANTRQSASGSNYGTSTYVAVEPGSQLRYGWFKFDTSSIKAGLDAQYGLGQWEVTAISFIGCSWETWNYKQTGNFQFFYNSNGSWGETSINWGNQPAQGALVANWSYDAVGDNPAQRVIALDPIAELRTAIKNGATFSIENHSDPSGTGQIAWEAKEFNPSYAAQLSVAADVVPEPGSLLALLSGVIGLVGFVGRRR